jgi:tRNA-splicing ligase RtcB
MKLIDNIPVFGPLESQDALEQIKSCGERAEAVALMADHHLGYSMPIGGVAAYDGFISPSGVGYDIACGNKAVKLDVDHIDVLNNIKPIMDEIARTISFGVGRTNNEEVDHELFDDPAWSIKICGDTKEKARQQLGTVGSGNHYVDIFIDDNAHIWVGVHFGSRGLGHTIATYFLKEAGGKDGLMVPPTLIDEKTSLGADYIAAMHLAGRYAYAGRDWVCSRVAKILGANVVDEVHNHHNFAWKENHFGKDLWVVRKGATPAFPGQRGFVGGSMGESSVILEGVEHENSRQALYSTVHGAGRVMGRMEAAGKSKWVKDPVTGVKVLKQIREGKVSRSMMDEWIKNAGVELRGGGLDESPHCYKRLNEVLDAHEGTIQVKTELVPIGVAMAGANEFDPYKD